MATYFCSDLHGEYDLFMRLLDKCNIESGDTVYVLGDIIDKGKNGFRLLEFIRKNSLFKAICGNHEYALLQTYHDYMMEYTGKNDAEILQRIRSFFPLDGQSLSWEMIDYVETLPFYIEKPDFIGVHAGLQLLADGTVLPMREQNVNNLVFDRKFKEDRVIPLSNKAVLFGHTPCSYENGTGAFIKMRRPGASGEKLSDYIKIRLDTGVAFTRTVGMLRADDMKEVYLSE